MWDLLYSPQVFKFGFIFILGGTTAFSVFILNNSIPTLRLSFGHFLTGGLSALVGVALLKFYLPALMSDFTIVAAICVLGGTLNLVALPNPARHFAALVTVAFVRDKKLRPLILKQLYPDKDKVPKNDDGGSINFEATGRFSQCELEYLSERERRKSGSQARAPPE